MAKFFDKSVLQAFKQYTWPGNIRELRNVTERMVLTSPRDEVRLSLLPRFILEGNDSLSDTVIPAIQADDPHFHGIEWDKENRSFRELMNQQEKDLLQSALAYYGSPAKTAKALRIDLSNVYRKMQKYGL